MSRIYSVAILFTLLAQVCGAQAVCTQPQSTAFSHYKKMDVSDGWFDVYQLPGHVYAFYEPRQEQEVLSYLIVGEKRALLFDSGLGIGKLGEIVRRLTALPVVVLNSHTHFDHVGGNSEFTEIYGVDSAFTRDNAEGYPNAYMLKNAGPSGACPPLPAGFDFARYSIKPFHIAHTVHDGEIIDLGGRKLEVLLTPGHTPDGALPPGSQAEGAIHGRHVLSRRDLAVVAGDGSGRVSKVHSAHRSLGPFTPGFAAGALRS